MSNPTANIGDEADGKATRWMQKHQTRAFSSRSKAMRYLLGMLEAGVYLTTIKVFDLNDAMRVHRATRSSDLPDVTERPRKGAGRPKRRKKHHETEDERVRRLARDRKRKSRQKTTPTKRKPRKKGKR